jgi:hypothetical protein
MNRQETLPLFPTKSRNVADFKATGQDVNRPPPRTPSGWSGDNPHLLAARKLSRKIKRLPDHSKAQSDTAHAICQHLRLMLNAQAEITPRREQRSGD